MLIQETFSKVPIISLKGMWSGLEMTHIRKLGKSSCLLGWFDFFSFFFFFVIDFLHL